jgi:hypothetical protein
VERPLLGRVVSSSGIDRRESSTFFKVCKFGLESGDAESVEQHQGYEYTGQEIVVNYDAHRG